IARLKQKMLSTHKLISTMTLLQSTYLKLCKEFNYLLEKFNKNEKAKIMLIQENKELRILLKELLDER
ncbi:hypothetical protein BABINDRAFT_25760, partial [Babjeviella inositovora NRRL Y-12698]